MNMSPNRKEQGSSHECHMIRVSACAQITLIDNQSMARGVAYLQGEQYMHTVVGHEALLAGASH